MKLTPAGATANNGKVQLHFADPSGGKHEVDLSVFDVSTLVSMLYEMRAGALKQKRDECPEVSLPINEIWFGDDVDYALLRISVGPGLHQDFAARKGTGVANMLLRMSEELAKEPGYEPPPAPPSSSKH